MVYKFTPPKLTEVTPHFYRLESVFRFEDDKGWIKIYPIMSDGNSFITDITTSPRGLKKLFRLNSLVPDPYPFGIASLVHDGFLHPHSIIESNLYTKAEIEQIKTQHKRIDDIYLDYLLRVGVPEYIAYPMYWAVRCWSITPLFLKKFVVTL